MQRLIQRSSLLSKAAFVLSMFCSVAHASPAASPSTVSLSTASLSTVSAATETTTSLPTITITNPPNAAPVPLATFEGKNVNGTASSPLGISAVFVAFSRWRLGMDHWNGTAFTPAGFYLRANLSGSGTSVTWNLDKLAPPISHLEVGDYRIKAYALDTKANKSEIAFQHLVFSDDFTAPTITITSPRENQKISMSDFIQAGIRGTISDNLQVGSVEFQLIRYRNGAYESWNGYKFTRQRYGLWAELDSYGATSSTWGMRYYPPQSALDVGAYALYIHGFDGAGNKSIQLRRDFTITPPDTTAPQLTIVSPTSRQRIAKKIFVAGSIKGTATDNKGVAGVQVQLLRFRGGAYEYWNGTAFTSKKVYLAATLGAPKAASTTWTLQKHPSQSLLDTGDYAIYVFATDTAGNQNLQLRRDFTITNSTTSSEAPNPSTPNPSTPSS